MDKTEIWDKSLNATSPFFDPSTISKLPIDVCESLVSLCQQLLLSHVSRVDQSKGNDPHHPSLKVFRLCGNDFKSTCIAMSAQHQIRSIPRLRFRSSMHWIHFVSFGRFLRSVQILVINGIGNVRLHGMAYV